MSLSRDGPSKAQILLVADEPGNLVSLKAILDGLDVTLVEAHSGEEALHRLLEDEFAVVLLDVQMPGLDGFETAKLIRGREETRHTPIIFQTAYDTNRATIEQAYALGAVDFLVKPLMPVVLRAKVKGFIELLQYRQQVERQAEQLRRAERREFEQKLADENARLQQQREWLHVTLGSIGDAVVTTDPEGRVTFLNAVAESLTGWRQEQAAGRPLTEVFTIVNEMTRKAVENPVAKVIATGHIVGLVNHTVLIAKDGVERAIDDSAAPIKDAHGHVLGVVLVFRDVTERRRAEKTARFLASIVDSSDDAIIGKDVNGVITSWNQAAERLFGHSAAEALGRPVAMLAPPDRVDEMPALLARIRHGERVEHFDTVRRAKNGRLVPISLTVSPIKDEDGKIIGASKIARDISERKRAEEALHEEKERLHATLTGIGDAVIVTDAESRVTLMNPVAQALTGWKDGAAGRLLGEVFRIVNEQSRQPVESPVTKVIRQGVVVGLANHTALIAKDGGEVPIDDSGAPIRNAGGDIIGVVLVFRDVTERRRLERLQRDLQGHLEQQVQERTADLRASEERFRLLVEGTQDYAIFLLDPEGRVVSWNPGAERIKGYTAEEIVGQHFSRFYPPEAVERGWPAEELRRAAAEGRFEDEGWRVRQDGSRFWANVVITALHDEAGNLRGFSKITRDLTERRRAEEAIRQANAQLERRVEERTAALHHEREMLRVTLASIGDAVIATDTQGRVTFLNPVAEALTGWDGEEAQGQPLEAVFPILHEQTRRPVENPVARVIREGVFVGLGNHTVLIARDETQRPIDDSAAPIRGAKGETVGVVLTFRDVTEQRQAETVLRRQASLLEQTHDAIFVWEFPGPILYWNQAAAQLYGFPPQEAIGKVSHDLLATVFPQQNRVAFEAALEQQGEFQGELIHTKKNGERITVESRSRLLTEAHGKRLVLETSRDITGRKAAEEEQRRLLAALSEADRRKDEFLAMLAHELRNPLAPIRNALHVMKQAGADGAVLERVREMMERQVQHMTRMVDDLLDVSRITRGKIELRKEAVDLASVVERTVEAIRPLIEDRRQELTVDLPPEPVRLEADPTRLEQVLANLLNNAAKYTDHGGHVWLTARQEGGELVLRVKDTGVGMAPAMLPRIFEPFVQADRVLHQSQGGLGIGLTLVRRLVEMHGGNVSAYSEGPGKGSEFVVRLPALSPKQPITGERSAGEGSESVGAAPQHRILVVDDNVDAAESLAMLLRMEGQDVRVAHDGPAALAAVEADPPDLVFLDIGMPVMNGYDVARRLRQRPGLEKLVLVAMTGWGQEEDRRRSQEAGFDHHLVKPVEPDALHRLLARPQEARPQR
jgi:PAS domain S-box-containing protein